MTDQKIMKIMEGMLETAEMLLEHLPDGTNRFIIY